VTPALRSTTRGSDSQLTLVALPKPFEGEFEVIQWNAIQSWARLRPRPIIVLVGDEPGTAELAAEVEAVHVPSVARSQLGTPLVPDVFARAEQAAQTSLLCYVNADIVLTSDFSRALVRVARRQRFLLVGRRWDLLIDDRLSFAPGWEREIRRTALSEGRPHEVTGIDYFVYRKGMWGDIPGFAIGRFAWDNWLVRRARDLGIPVIDASAAVLAIHQDHAPGALDGSDAADRESERLANIALAGPTDTYYTLDDATHLLMRSGPVVPAWTPRHLQRRRLLLRRELTDRFPALAAAVTGARGLARRWIGRSP
jgi:hypothetical protein